MAHEPAIRLAATLVVFAAVAAGELVAPRRPLRVPKLRRWLHNIAIWIVGSLTVRFAFPLLAVGMALLAEQHGFGLLRWFGTDTWLAVPLAVMALDFAIYAQHVAFHHVPVLWRLHRMHHADNDIDVTTGTRFHPLEYVLSMLIKLAAVALLGAPAVAVLIFEVALNATSMFNHGNLRLPAGVDRLVRTVLVTPDMHRVHHSVIGAETNSNFGFNLPWWDWIFDTYRAQPQAGHDGMTIGLPDYQAATRQNLWWLLLVPFRSPASTRQDQA